jgi:hypothetical protein
MSAPSQNPNAVVQASKDSSKGKRFFFEKKKQKTFDYLIPGCLLRSPFGWGGHAGGDSEPSAKSFVAFFFKKETLCCSPKKLPNLGIYRILNIHCIQAKLWLPVSQRSH